jgi:hypothetical protein
MQDLVYEKLHLLDFYSLHKIQYFHKGSSKSVCHFPFEFMDTPARSLSTVQEIFAALF